jgi:RNase P subunit RPR2
VAPFDPLDAANAWTGMTCPHCGNVYRYNVRSGEVAK